MTSKKKAPKLSLAEQEYIRKKLEDEANRFKRPIKMLFVFKTPHGEELHETARFRSVEEGVAYGKDHEVAFKKYDQRWQLISSAQVNLPTTEESQFDVQD